MQGEACVTANAPMKPIGAPADKSRSKAHRIRTALSRKLTRMSLTMMTRISRLMLVICHAVTMYRQLSLPKNAQKGTWRHMEIRQLLDLARREYEELFVACWELEHGKGTAERVAEEAADLSNFAAMVADRARRNERG